VPIFSGIIIDAILVFSNACSSICDNDLDNITFYKLLHPLNAYSPTLVTESGINICVKLV